MKEERQKSRKMIEREDGEEVNRRSTRKKIGEKRAKWEPIDIRTEKTTNVEEEGEVQKVNREILLKE